MVYVIEYHSQKGLGNNYNTPLIFPSPNHHHAFPFNEVREVREGFFRVPVRLHSFTPLLFPRRKSSPKHHHAFPFKEVNVMSRRNTIMPSRSRRLGELGKLGKGFSEFLYVFGIVFFFSFRQII